MEKGKQVSLKREVSCFCVFLEVPILAPTDARCLRLATSVVVPHQVEWSMGLQSTSQSPCMLQRKRDTGAGRRTSCPRVERAASTPVWLKRGSSTTGRCRVRSGQSFQTLLQEQQAVCWRPLFQDGGACRRCFARRLAFAFSSRFASFLVAIAMYNIPHLERDI